MDIVKTRERNLKTFSLNQRVLANPFQDKKFYAGLIRSVKQNEQGEVLFADDQLKFDVDRRYIKKAQDVGDESANYDGPEDKNENGDKHVRDYTEDQKKDSNLDGPGATFFVNVK